MQPFKKCTACFAYWRGTIICSRDLSMSKKVVCWIALAGLLLSCRSGLAHQTKTAYVSLDFVQDTLRVVYKFDLTDLERAFHLDTNGNRIIDREELLGRIDELYAYVEAHTTLRLDYWHAALQRQESTFEQDAAGNLFIDFNFQQAPLDAPGALSLHLDLFEAFGADFKVLGRLVYGENLQQMIFTDATPIFSTDLRAEGIGLLRQLRAFVLLGIEHIFIGIDHIMFLFGLLVIGGSFWNLTKIVSAFTASHSLTLILAAMNLVVLPAWIVESVIALSIVYIAIENFYLEKADKRWVVTGLFGLVHGFGFASVLGDLGLPAKGLVASLFAFNAGVEIGQIVIVSLLLPVIWLFLRTRYKLLFIRAASAVIFLFGATWFLERAFQIPVGLL